jgi:hypothetical protein
MQRSRRSGRLRTVHLNHETELALPTNSPRRRRHPRTADTQDLEATIWQSRHRCTVGRVLNLSETGMLVSGQDVDAGDVAAFELSGPDFRFAGYAEVVHVTNGAMGLHVLGWRGPASGRVHSLITRRIRGDARGLQAPEVPGEFLG